MTWFRSLSLALASALALVDIAQAQPAFQVADLNTKTPGTTSFFVFGSIFATLGSNVYFAADDGLHGVELWKTDGSEKGTRMVRDLCPGACSGLGFQIIAWNGALYFQGDDGVRGAELWKTDGTAAGTTLVADIFPGLGSSHPGGFTLFGSQLYFLANDGTHGSEPWKSDGTAAGTTLLADIRAGFEGSDSWYWTQVGTRLLFGADDGVHGEELWTTDGSTTALLRDIRAGAPASLIRTFSTPFFPIFAKLGSQVLFAADDGATGYELWSTDGTFAGTQPLLDLAPGTDSSTPSWFVTVGTKVYFRAADSNGLEPWTTDGTVAGTQHLGDLNVGSAGSNPSEFTSFGDAVYFAATDAVNGRELWKSDGTTAGTALVQDIFSGSGNGLSPFFALHRLTVVGGRLAFFANDGVSGTELWSSDGTSAGTTLLADLAPGSPSSYFGNLPPDLQITASGTWYFRVFSSAAEQGPMLWKTDGTAVGTQFVSRINQQASAFAINLTGLVDSGRPISAFNNTVLMQAGTGTTGFEIAKSDGTAAGTLVLRDIVAGPEGSFPQEITSLDSTAVFAAPLSSDTELWVTDGSPAGTNRLLDILPGGNGSNPSEFTRFANRVNFAASDGDGVGQHGRELWVTDGTAAGTTLFKDIAVGTGSSSPSDLTPIAFNLFFAATDADGRELWSSDGTSAGTIKFKDIAAGAASSNPTRLTRANLSFDTLLPFFFFADNGATGQELWWSDGTSVGTNLAKDVRPGPLSSQTFSYANGFNCQGEFSAILGGSLVFVADDGASGAELWISDGTSAGTTRFADLVAGPGSADPCNLVGTADRVFFTANDGFSGRELWMTDGTAAGTVLLDLRPGPASSVPLSLASLGAFVMFSADDGISGRELWVSEGTVATTRSIQDLAPGPESSSPTAFTGSGPNAYFVANDGDTGFELWSMPRTSFGAHLRATKRVSGQLFVGGTVVYTLVLTNDGPGRQADENGAELSDVVAPQLTITSVSATSGVATFGPNPQTARWNGALAAGQSVTITIRATLAAVPQNTTITNSANLAWDSDGDGNFDTIGNSDDPDLPGASDATGFSVGLAFYTVPPCRAVDTRSGAAITSNVTRSFTITGLCGIPTSAKAISANLTAVVPGGTGSLNAWAAGTPLPGTSAMNYRAGVTRANNAIVALGGNGAVDVRPVLDGNGALHFLIDVNGYFE